MSYLRAAALVVTVFVVSFLVGTALTQMVTDWAGLALGVE